MVGALLEKCRELERANAKLRAECARAETAGEDPEREETEERTATLAPSVEELGELPPPDTPVPALDSAPGSSAVAEEVQPAQLTELAETVATRQRHVLLGLRQIYRLAFLLIKSRDGVLRSGLNIGSVQLLGFELRETKAVSETLLYTREMDLETVLLLQKQEDLTLGGCTLICDLLMNIYRVIAPTHVSLRHRLKQRRGRYYFAPYEQSSEAGEEVQLALPTERKQLTQQSDFYRKLLTLVVQLTQYTHSNLRLVKQQAGPPSSEDLFLHLCYLFENV